MSLKIHFLNVGHGDCTIIEFPDHLTVVDINNCKRYDKDTREELRKRYSAETRYPINSLFAAAGMDARLDEEQKSRLVDPIDYLKRHFPGQSIFRYIQSHPDMDHMGGLYRLRIEGISITNFWDTDNSITKEEELSKWANVNHDEKDWDEYQSIRGGQRGCTVLKLKQGAANDFYRGDGISIWAPFENTKSQDPNADPNYFSYVLQIQWGKCSVVLGGDLPSDMWDKLLERNGGTLPKVQLLKASHHGRKSGYSLNAVKSMSPDVTICSVGELHSKHDAYASYERFSSHGCYSTVDHGTIFAHCWEDGDVWLYDSSGNRFAVTMGS